ncbi:hypothetical protein PIB30_005522 [Stylosanthes scabra]|uniref:non-specific serine/threonine protein kinase n=1 Tax=Stylosanthes scabra TaxID=79078 RepID=A0ABU6Q403_9FABA|nr:hypothetical protein [Stylosanthes scabra]
MHVANAQIRSFNLNKNFNPAQSHELSLDGDATYSQAFDHVQLTGKTDTPMMGFGRITTKPMRLMKNYSEKQRYDFTTNFSFLVISNRTYHGEGLAFFIASPELPLHQHDGGINGGGLGLLNPCHPRPDEYSFVAVEFDTHSDSFDPRGPQPHVGIDVNSMISTKHVKWPADFSDIATVYNCSVVYSTGSRRLDVYFTGGSFNGPAPKNLSTHLDLTDYLYDPVTLGISASTRNYTVQFSLLSWSFSAKLSITGDENRKGSKKLKEGLEIGTAWFLSLLVLVLVLDFIHKRRRRRKHELDPMDHEFQTGTGPQRISYNRLVSATNNFEEAKKLGKGGFGGVYKGYFKDTDSYAAVKKISADSRQGINEYAAEVKIISQLRHRNLVRLTGWCHKKNEFILIYEYMPNGSLDYCLFDGVCFLSWQVRYNIALGLASALLYLQEGWEKCVLHRDIKSSNIMLDSEFNAKLGDFGLARLVDHEKGSRTTKTAGTLGYIAPEYIKTGKVGKESDIYSFGVVLLEIASGKKVIHHREMEGRVTQVSLVEWVWELYGLRNIIAAADSSLCRNFDVQQMECILVVGLWCAHPDSKCRPSIRQVLKVLNFDAPLPVLPQRMPILPPFLLPHATNEIFFTAISIQNCYINN